MGLKTLRLRILGFGDVWGFGFGEGTNVAVVSVTAVFPTSSCFCSDFCGAFSAYSTFFVDLHLEEGMAWFSERVGIGFGKAARFSNTCSSMMIRKGTRLWARAPRLGSVI